MIAGCVIAAITSGRPPHCAHTRTSDLNTRAINCAHDRRRGRKQEAAACDVAAGSGAAGVGRSERSPSHRLSPLRPRREHPVVSERIAARPGHENSKFFDQLRWLENDMRRPVSPRVTKSIRDPPIGEFEQPLSGDWRSRNVPAQSFKPSAILAPDSHSRVQAEALNSSTLLPDSLLHVLDGIPESHPLLAGTQARGNAMPNRSLRTRRKQGLRLLQRIR